MSRRVNGGCGGWQSPSRCAWPSAFLFCRRPRLPAAGPSLSVDSTLTAAPPRMAAFGQSPSSGRRAHLARLADSPSLPRAVTMAGLPGCLPATSLTGSRATPSSPRSRPRPSCTRHQLCTGLRSTPRLRSSACLRSSTHHRPSTWLRLSCPLSRPQSRRLLPRRRPCRVSSSTRRGATSSEGTEWRPPSCGCGFPTRPRRLPPRRRHLPKSHPRGRPSRRAEARLIGGPTKRARRFGRIALRRSRSRIAHGRRGRPRSSSSRSATPRVGRVAGRATRGAVGEPLTDVPGEVGSSPAVRFSWRGA